MGVFQIQDSPFIVDSILTKSHHESESLAGWLGLATWMVQDDNGYLWDVDWRYAFGTEIFKQHWIDFGWDEKKLLHRRKRNETKRHKAIIYICAPEMVIPGNYSGLAKIGTNKTQETERHSSLLENPLWHPIPERYLLGEYWQSIYRCLISMAKLPQGLQELLPETLPTDSKTPYRDYTTTRNLQKTPPEIINSQEDEVRTVLALPPHPNRKGEGGLRTKELFKHSGSEEKPLISVITVVYNNVALLEQTIQSVINQSSARVEYIIIDGGSTDETLELIQQYDKQINYWISEPDEGIYFAMNKGIEVSNGSLITFMNSGDYYNTINVFDSIDKPCFIPTVCQSHNGKIKQVKVRDVKFSMPYCHQGIVFKNDGFRYDLDYSYAADYDFYIRHGYTVLPFSKTGKVYYDNRGVSSVDWNARKENIAIVTKYFGVFYGFKAFVVLMVKYIVIKIIYWIK